MPGLGHDVNRSTGVSIFVNDFTNEIEAIQLKAKWEAAKRAAAAAALSTQDSEAQAKERERLRAEAEAAAEKKIADLKAANAQLAAEKSRLEAQNKVLTGEKSTLSSEKATLASEKRNVDSTLATMTQRYNEQLRGLWTPKKDSSGEGCLPEIWNGRTVMIWNKNMKCAIDASPESGFMYSWRPWPGNPNQMIRLELFEWPYWKLKHHDKYLETQSKEDGSIIERLPDRDDKYPHWLRWRIFLDSDRNIRLENFGAKKGLYIKDPQENKDGLQLQSRPLGENGQYWGLLMVE